MTLNNYHLKFSSIFGYIKLTQAKIQYEMVIVRENQKQKWFLQSQNNYYKDK